MTDASQKLSLFHRLYSYLYPAIRFSQESLAGNAWFTQVTPAPRLEGVLWLGGAPTSGKDFEFLLKSGMRAVVNIRAEREDDLDFYAQHGIESIRFYTPEFSEPDVAVLNVAIPWIHEQMQQGPVLVHCAKGRGRSAALVAGYLMKYGGYSYLEAAAFLKLKRPLTKLEGRHRKQLEAWLAQYA